MTSETPRQDNAAPRDPSPAGDEAALIAALRAGSETAFEGLISQYHGALSRLAYVYLHDARLVEEVLQETWIAVLRGLDKFEGRSSLKTWIFSILVNRAKTLAQREDRYTSLVTEDEGEDLLEGRFFPADHEYANEWISIPRSWGDIPEERLLSAETLAVIRRTIEALPPNQREVITLRDIEEWPSEDICNVLGVTETNQRVLLHRARSKVRLALEQYLNGQA